MTPVTAMVVASLGIASVFGVSRPQHVLTGLTEAPSFLRTWRPDMAGTDLAGRVRESASENARTSAAGAVHIADVTRIASGELSDIRSSLEAFFVPAEPFFRLAGTLPAPVSNRASARFGPRDRRGSATADRHTGYSYGVEPGIEVRSVAPGYVSFSGAIRGLGVVVIIDHGEQYHSVYGHLLSASVEGGELVVAEQRVGLGGGLATSGSPEVYFEIRDRGVPVNPADWLR